MKKAMSLILAMMLIAAVLTGCGGGADNSSPEAAVRSFFNATVAGNLDGMINCMPPSTQEYVRSMIELAKQMGQDVDPSTIMGENYANAKSMTIDINNVEIDGDSASVDNTVTIVYNDGTTDTETSSVPCVKENGKWYVDLGM